MKLTAQVLMCIVFLWISDVAIAADSKKASKKKNVDWAIEIIRNESGLLDGDSAKFRNVRQIDEITVCGEVNAKNLYGAYVGFQDFVVAWGKETPEHFTIIDKSDDEFMTNYHRKQLHIMCKVDTSKTSP